MAHEFKVKNALQILNSHAVSNISNDLNIFDTYDVSSLATVSAIRQYFETLDVSGSFVGALPDLTDVSDDLNPDETSKYLVYNTTTNLWEAGTSDSLWTVDGSMLSPSDPTLNIAVGAIDIIPNSGEITVIDMPVTLDASLGAPQSYSFDLDGNIVMKIYTESDGTGGIENTSLIMQADYQYIGDPSVNGTWRFYVDEVTTDLIYEKKVLGLWVEGGKFSV